MLPTYTNVFRSRSRRLYHVAGWELPRSVPIAQALGFLAVAALNVFVLRLAGIRWDPGRTWLWVVPPAVGVYGLSRPVADARRLHEWLWAQIRHLCEAKTLHGLRRSHDPAPGSWSRNSVGYRRSRSRHGSIPSRIGTLET
jgi:hypothetical protein